MPTKPFALSCKVVVRDEDGRCLVLRRSRNSGGSPGKWEFPGGKVELGENFDVALLREVAEETGLAVSLEHVVGATEFELTNRKVAYLILEGRLTSGDVRLSSEHEEYDWVSPQALSALDLVEQFGPFAEAYGRRES
jgi:8-oxo-dGTP diphosphatase